MAIVTLTEYKAYAGITGTTYDTALQTLLDAAHARIRRYCGRSLSNGFEAATRTETYDPTDTEKLQLLEWPLTSVTTIKPIDDENTVGDAIDSTGYHTDLASGIITLNGAASGRFLGSRVSRDYGFAYRPIDSWGTSPSFGRVQVVYVTGAPAADVYLAVCILVDGMFAGRRRDPSVASASLGSTSVSYKSEADAWSTVANLLGPFRGGA